MTRYAEKPPRSATAPRALPREAAVMVAALAPLLVFAPMAWRWVDVDEGSYTLAARLVADGQIPYRDFVHMQTPLLPYVFGGWIALVGESWLAVRALGALIAIGLGGLLYRYLAARHGRGLAALGVLLYASSALSFGQLGLVKTLGLSTLLLFAGFVVAEGRRYPLATQGALALGLVGLAAQARLLVVVAAPLFVWQALRAAPRAKRGRVALACAAGFAVASAPSVVLFALDPARFLFDNVRLHSLRSPDGLVGNLGQKVDLAASLVGFGPYVCLTLLGLVSLAVIYRLEGRVPFSLQLALVLTVACFLPTPAYESYLAVTVPFVVVAAIELVGVVRARTSRAPTGAAAKALRDALAVVVAVYVASGLWVLSSYDNPDDPGTQLTAVRDVSREVDRRTRPGEEVLASWPGYLFGTHARPVSGLETDFAPTIAAQLSADDARRFLLASSADVETMIRGRRTRLVVVRRWLTYPGPDWEQALRDGGYEHVGDAGHAQIYALPA